MFPMDRQPTPVTVEYTSRGKRVRRTFPDAHAAKRFYAAKHRAGKDPKVLAALLPEVRSLAELSRLCEEDERYRRLAVAAAENLGQPVGRGPDAWRGALRS